VLHFIYFKEETNMRIIMRTIALFASISIASGLMFANVYLIGRRKVMGQ
jgi:hypothetical protein